MASHLVGLNNLLVLKGVHVLSSVGEHLWYRAGSRELLLLL
jgi:hypothetical protein